MRKKPGCHLTALTLAIAWTSLSAAAVPAEQPPNIVLIMADDLGYGELGCYGQQMIRTPHLDQLALQGMRFTDHHCGAPVCAPSRCVLLTGKHLAHAQIRDNRDSGQGGQFPGQWPLDEGTVTFAGALQSAGYATGAFGKWGLGPDDSTGAPQRQGFDEFFGYNCQRLAHSYYPPFLSQNGERVVINEVPVPGHLKQLDGDIDAAKFRGGQYAPDLIVDRALEFIEAHRHGPFLLYVPLIEPHLAMHPPQDWIDHYPTRWDEGHGPYRGENGYLPHPRPRAAYAAMISHLDSHVGRILDKLEQAGVADHTLVVFTSDNGPTHPGNDPRFFTGGAACDYFDSTAGLRGYKGSGFEGGIRVPCIVRWPGNVAPGTVCDAASYFPDWFPTLCAAAGVDVPESAAGDGISLLPLFDNPNASIARNEPMIWEFHGYGGWIVVRDGPWKLVKRQWKNKANRPWELFNLSIDPQESNNVAEGHVEIVERLAQNYVQTRIPEPDFPTDDDATAGQADDWVPLFDGTSLQGWTQRGGAAKYSVEDEQIVGETVPNTPNSFLCTDESFADFLLELEVLVDSELNSGVQIRSATNPEYRNGVVHGYQVEIDPSDRAWTAGIYDESRSGWLFDLAHRPNARYAFRPNEWNHLRVAAVGQHIRTWLNGVQAADFLEATTPSGFIALQVHGVGGRSEPLRVRFRNVRILRDPPLTVFSDEPSPTAPASIFSDPPQIQLAAAGLRFAEGPAVGPDGAIYFSDIPQNRIQRHDPATGETTVFREPSGGANGLAFSPSGALLACESQGRAVARIADGQRSVRAEKIDEKRLNSPNDLTLDGYGGIYFTDPRYGDRSSMELSQEGLYYVDRGGKLTLLSDAMTRPNGLELSPDGNTLYVADHGAGQLWAFDVVAAGRLENQRLFADVGSDGMTVDAFGNVFVTWQQDVIVLNPQGLELDRLTLPAAPTNCVLLGSDLFVTTPQALYRIETSTRGLDLAPARKPK